LDLELVVLLLVLDQLPLQVGNVTAGLVLTVLADQQESGQEDGLQRDGAGGKRPIA